MIVIRRAWAHGRLACVLIIREKGKKVFDFSVVMNGCFEHLKKYITISNQGFYEVHLVFCSFFGVIEVPVSRGGLSCKNIYSSEITAI